MIATIIAACAAAVAIFSSVVTVVVTVAGYRERKDLYDRIMCGGAKEYRAFTGETPKAPKSRHEEMLKAWRRTTDGEGDK